MLTKKKKIFMLAGMVLLLAATVWLNAVLAANADTPGDGDVLTGNFFANFRAERQATRLETITYLDSIIETSEAEFEAQRATAMARKEKLIEAMEQEVNIENILRAQGFEDVGVTISVTSNNVTVIVKSELTVEDTAKIYNVLWEQAEIDANDVSITPM